MSTTKILSVNAQSMNTLKLFLVENQVLNGSMVWPFLLVGLY